MKTQPFPAFRAPVLHPTHRAPKHRSDREQDACSLVCQAAYEGGGNCDTYVGRHRAGVRG